MASIRYLMSFYSDFSEPFSATCLFVKQKKKKKAFSELLACVIFLKAVILIKGNGTFVPYFDVLKEDGRVNWRPVCPAACS